ncbi:hypothetical protein [Methylobacterium sp.]|uniref:hypothetical protein n=1 Tax=Methylobacterium sp. TaxID=409 RepID=UPI0025D8D22B|nr:hypothetical protein [Methylobacterium sp.]
MTRPYLSAAASAAAVLCAMPALAADLDRRASALPPEVPSSFFLFSDTQVSYRWVMDAREPGIPATRGNPLEGRSIPKNVLNISHANAWAYGTNFFSLDILKSGSQDPSGYAFPNLGIQTGVGATEAYGLYRGTLSGNALTGTKAFSFPGFVKDVSLSYGTDLNSKNTSFGSEKRLVVAGLNFAFDVPAGFFNLAVHASKEFNRNGIVPLPARDTEFNFTPEFEIVYNIPLPFTGLPLSLAGFNNIVMPKGKDGFGAETVTEFLSRTNLVLDLGKLVYDQPNRVDVFVGFQYWRNKFGNNAARVAGSEEKTFLAGVSFHIF